MGDQYQAISCFACDRKDHQETCFKCERLKHVSIDALEKWRAVGWQSRGRTLEGEYRIIWLDDPTKMVIPE